MNYRLAIIEDDNLLRENYTDVFGRQGYLVDAYSNREQAQEVFQSRLPDLAIIDIGLGDEVDGGFALCQWLRAKSRTLPIIFLSARDDDIDIVSGLRMGADDYLRKPFELEELKARVEHIVRIYRLQEEIEFDGMKFVPKAHQIHVDDRVIEMRQKEAQVLEYFIRNSGKIISCDEIIENVWDDEHMPAHATIRTYIKNLRKMFTKEYFDNIKGEGYRFNIV